MELDLAAAGEQVETLKRPKPFPVEKALPMDDETRERLAQAVWDEKKDGYEELLHKEVPDTVAAWEKVADAAEEYLKRRTVGVPGQAGTKGRAKPP